MSGRKPTANRTNQVDDEVIHSGMKYRTVSGGDEVDAIALRDADAAFEKVRHLLMTNADPQDSN
jgi:hypothetical protein